MVKKWGGTVKERDNREFHQKTGKLLPDRNLKEVFLLSGVAGLNGSDDHMFISSSTGQWSLPIMSVCMRASAIRSRRRSDATK